MLWRTIVFLLITTVHLQPHGLLMWLGIWLLKQALKQLLISSFSLPKWTTFLQVTWRETNVAKSLAIPVPRALIATCLGIILSAKYFYTVLKLSEDALQIIVIYFVSEAFLSLQIPVWLCVGLTNQALGRVFSKNAFI